jgi:hypothetical protein
MFPPIHKWRRYKASWIVTPQKALIEDESAPSPVKTLAAILNDLTHTPTEADKETLRQPLQQILKR